MIDQGRPIGRPFCIRQLEESSVLMKKADIVGGLIGILIGLYAIWEGTKMPEDLVMKIGPSFFPNILAGFLILFSAILIVNALRGKSKGEVAPLRIDPLGFLLTSIIFLTFMMWIMGNRKPIALAIAPTVITLAVWLVFEKVLNLSMPAGILVDIL
jgi:hypothetical protein